MGENSAYRDGEALTTEEELEENVEPRGEDEVEEYVEQRGEDEVEEYVEQRGEEEREVEMEQRGEEERVETRPYSEDPSDWPPPHQIGDSFRQCMVENGPPKCPDGPYPRSEKGRRSFSKAYCYHSMSNGEKVLRDWLLYSKSMNKVYCFACKLFGGARVVDTRFVVGYNNWQCLSKSLQHHDTSSYHINAYLLWKELASRLTVHCKDL